MARLQAMSGTVEIDFSVPSGARVWIDLHASGHAALI